MTGRRWLPLVLAAAYGVAVIGGDSGLPVWLELRGELAGAQQRIAALRAELETLRRQARELEGDPFAAERAIREELGFALPGETVVRLGRGPVSGDVH